MIRRVSAALALPVAATMGAVGWYGLRTMVFASAAADGMSASQVSGLATAMLVAGLIGTASAPLVAAAVGPSVTASIGLGVTAVGAATFGLVPSELWLAAIGLAGFGTGLHLPALYAAAARPFSRADLGWIAAIALGITLGIEGGAAVASRAAPAIGALSPVALFAGLSAALALGSVAAGINAAIQGLVPVAAPPDTDTLHPPTLWVGSGLALGGAVCAALLGIGSDARFDVLLPAFDDPSTLFAADQGGRGLSALILAGVFAATALGRIRLSPPVVGGFGYALAGVFLLPTSVSVAVPSLALPLAVLAGAAEIAAFAPLVAGAIGGVHWRLSTAVVAVPMAAGAMAAWVTSFADVVPAWLLVSGSGVSLALGGLALACAAFLAERWLADQPETRDAP